MYSIAGLMELVKGLRFKNKKAASFGCYGWHDVASKQIESILRESGFQVILESLSCNWSPDEELIEMSIDFGKSFVTKLKENQF